MISSRLSVLEVKLLKQGVHLPTKEGKNEMKKQAVAIASPERDRIRVLVRSGNEPHRSFYLTVMHLGLNGKSVRLFGRPGQDMTDRTFEAEEVVFRREEDLEHFVRFAADSLLSRRKRFVWDPFGEEDDSVIDDTAGPLRQKIWKCFTSHPSIKIDGEIFKR